MPDDKDRIKKIALYLAGENKKAEPGIIKILWFPHDEEVRLIEVEENIPYGNIDEVEPFYFGPSLDVPAPLGIAIIHSKEYRQLKLPDNWGSWEDAEELETN
jgi:hypothetical protein